MEALNDKVGKILQKAEPKDKQRGGGWEKRKIRSIQGLKKVNTEKIVWEENQRKKYKKFIFTDGLSSQNNKGTKIQSKQGHYRISEYQK